MRLIDADKVKEYILTEGFCCDTQADKESTAEELDELFPTVKAIPIEFIERKLAEHWYVDYDIRELLEDWEKENEEGN